MLRIGGSYKHNFPTALNLVWKGKTDDTWTPGPATDQPRLWAAAETVNETAFVLGGLRVGFIRNEVFMEYLDPNIGVWQAGPADSSGWTWGGGSAVSGDSLILLGGVREDETISTDIRVYDTVSQTWEVFPGVLDPLYRFSSAGNESFFVTAGGYDATNKKSSATKQFDFCPAPEVGIDMPDTNLRFGEPFDLSIDVTFDSTSIPNVQTELHKNNGEKRLPAGEYPLFVILAAFGEYFFAPSFGEFDFFPVTPTTGTQEIQVLPAFNWPQVDGNASGLLFYAAFTNQEFNALYGNLDFVEWGWSN